MSSKRIRHTWQKKTEVIEDWERKAWGKGGSGVHEKKDG